MPNKATPVKSKVTDAGKMSVAKFEWRFSQLFVRIPKSGTQLSVATELEIFHGNTITTITTTNYYLDVCLYFLEENLSVGLSSRNVLKQRPGEPSQLILSKLLVRVSPASAQTSARVRSRQSLFKRLSERLSREKAERQPYTIYVDHFVDTRDDPSRPSDFERRDRFGVLVGVFLDWDWVGEVNHVIRAGLASNKADVLRFSVRFFRWAIDQSNNGRKIISWDPLTNSGTELELKRDDMNVTRSWASEPANRLGASNSDIK